MNSDVTPVLCICVFLKCISNVQLDNSYTGRCRRGTRRLNDRLSWLWFGSTALYPSIYLHQQSLGGSRDAVLMVRSVGCLGSVPFFLLLLLLDTPRVSSVQLQLMSQR